MAPYKAGMGDPRLVGHPDACPTCRGLGATLAYEPCGEPDTATTIPVGRRCPTCGGTGTAAGRDGTAEG
jgi:DnaJ-class molecular chaperone